MQSYVTISKGRMDFLEDNKFFYFFAKKKKVAILFVHMFVCIRMYLWCHLDFKRIFTSYLEGLGK